MLYTININLRFALMAAGLVLGIGLWAAYGFWYGFPFLLASIILTVGYLLLGTLSSAGQMMQAGDIDGAEAQLKKTYFPNALFSANKSVYTMLLSTIAMHRQEWDKAESLIKKSLAQGLPTDNEKAVAIFQLSNLAARRNNWNMAQKYLDDLRGMNITEPMIKDQIKQMEQALKQRHMMKPGMMQMGFRPGGKRPRPRVR